MQIDPSAEEKKQGMPHYSEKRTWWAIILVAALGGLGGGLAKELITTIRNSMVIPPEQKVEERELVLSVAGERDEPVQATVSFLKSAENAITSEMETNNLGIARLTFQSAHGVGHYILVVQRGNQTFSKRGEFTVDEKRSYSQVHTFDASEWFPGDLRTVLSAARPTSSPSDTLTVSRPPTAISGAPWMSVALDEIGVREVRGPNHDPRVMEYWEALPSWESRATDELDWSSAFVAWTLQQVGIETIDSARNRDWINWGEPSEAVEGCVAVFWRESVESWKGHAAFLIDQDDSSYHVLGGNQANAVNITRIPKARFLGCRWPSK